MDIRDLGITIGARPRGRRNTICDVAGVRVGHCTIDDERSKTGVTVVMPCEGNIFRDKLIAASFVLNGFGKTLGLVQIDELGTLETPIALTNTLNVGLVHDALVEYSINACARDGVKLRSVNPVVCECNDASLNDITLRAVKKEHVFRAIESAGEDFALGDVGCGKGTTCHGLKGGVGSASRLVRLNGRDYRLGALVQTNHGRLRDFMIDGDPIGERIHARLNDNPPDKGSCIVILATDLPLSDRQLRRVLRRCGVGLARLGSFIGHGSGEVFVGFSTANRLAPDGNARDVLPCEALNENRIDVVFRAAAECAEEAVLNSMTAAEDVTGPDGATRVSLARFLAGGV